jgi:poly(A) polymerase/tRNA nucleotidyltransferase (CCA-adding enzyme)
MRVDGTLAVLRDPDLTAVMSILPAARLVGGAVRDAVAGLAVADMDLATPDAPETSMARLAAAGLRVIPTGLAHGTVTAIVNHRPFEITTLRRDVSTDGRHAAVAWTDDWRLDAARRDFTINAMSLGRDGDLHDYFGGVDDLRQGRVRFVGDAATRIAEDYLRILRFFRFWARYGRGEPDGAAVAAIRDAIPGLAILSAERIWSELKRILAAPDPSGAVALMARLGVLDAIVPEGADAGRLAALIARGAPADPLLRMAALLTGSADAFGERLKLSVAEQARMSSWRGGPLPASRDPSALRRLLAEEDAETLIGRVWLAGEPPDEAAGLRADLAAMARPVFPLEGRDALALGAAPGPAVGAALRAVRERWLAEGCVSGADVLRGWLAAALKPGALPLDPVTRERAAHDGGRASRPPFIRWS